LPWLTASPGVRGMHDTTPHANNQSRLTVTFPFAMCDLSSLQVSM